MPSSTVDRRGPAEQQHGLAPEPFGQPPGHEVERALDEAEGHDKSHEQQERALGHAELALGERRHHGAHHSERQAHQKHLHQLVQELGEVVADAMPIAAIVFVMQGFRGTHENDSAVFLWFRRRRLEVRAVAGFFDDFDQLRRACPGIVVANHRFVGIAAYLDLLHTVGKL
jgi:hypothetical protein